MRRREPVQEENGAGGIFFVGGGKRRVGKGLTILKTSVLLLVRELDTPQKRTMMDDTTVNDQRTLRLEVEDRSDVRAFRLVVVDCPEPPPKGLKRGLSWESSSDTCSVGSHRLNDVQLADNAVSRFHCTIQLEPEGICLRDLGSSNGTRVEGVRVMSAFLEHGHRIQVGRLVLRFEWMDRVHSVPIPTATCFGTLVSSSRAMRLAFGLMERAAAKDSTVLLEGETGTGKSTAAREIHRRSQRRDGPFVEVNCAALPPTLIEAELFGHEKGAFTGAVQARAGRFEAAQGGTLFLDEIAELPLALQAKLLLAAESGQINRLGSSIPVNTNVRIIAATHKNLRMEVNAGHFRSDLYYRLAVLCIKIPALRERPEDIAMITEGLLNGLDGSAEIKARLGSPASLAWLKSRPWPGNIRELRNHLEQSMTYEQVLPLEDTVPESMNPEIDGGRPYKDERERALAAFEREYLEKLLAHHSGNITRAAEGAQLARVYLHRLLRKHGIR